MAAVLRHLELVVEAVRVVQMARERTGVRRIVREVVVAAAQEEEAAPTGLM